MAIITPAPITRSGVQTILGTAADAAGDEWENTGAEVMFFYNNGGASRTVTLLARATVDGLAITNRTVVVPSGGAYMFGPFPPGIYNDGSNRAKVTYSAVTACYIKVLRCPRELA